MIVRNPQISLSCGFATEMIRVSRRKENEFKIVGVCAGLVWRQAKRLTWPKPEEQQ